MKKLLMLGTSYGTRLMLEYAKSQGVYTIVTDYQEPEHSPGKLIADEYWMINTGDLDALEAKCREENVNAVVCGISEFNLEMCMALCKRLGLPCYYTPEAWHYSRDKVDYKKLATSLGAPLATAPLARRLPPTTSSPIPRRERNWTQSSTPSWSSPWI